MIQNLEPFDPEKFPLIQCHETMVSAGVNVLGLHFEKMCQNEADTILGENIEALHDMRVATRRMRTAFSVFSPFYDPRLVAPLSKELKKTGKKLGAVRDYDVFLENARNYQIAQSQFDADQLQFGVDIWSSQRDQSRHEMVAYLHQDRYSAFKEEFIQFLNLPETLIQADPNPVSIAEIVPRLIRGHVENVYNHFRALTTPFVAELHALRIAFKHLRYNIEFFYHVLGPGVEFCMPILESIQDHLGYLNDARVAVQLLENYSVQNPALSEKNTSIADYFLAKQVELDALIASFPDTWATFADSAFDAQLETAISYLECR